MLTIFRVKSSSSALIYYSLGTVRTHTLQVKLNFSKYLLSLKSFTGTPTINNVLHTCICGLVINYVCYWHGKQFYNNGIDDFFNFFCFYCKLRLFGLSYIVSHCSLNNVTKTIIHSFQHYRRIETTLRKKKLPAERVMYFCRLNFRFNSTKK